VASPTPPSSASERQGTQTGAADSCPVIPAGQTMPNGFDPAPLFTPAQDHRGAMVEGAQLLLDAPDDGPSAHVEPIPMTDLVMVGWEVGGGPGQSATTTAAIIGHLDRATGKFTRQLAVANCALSDGVVDHELLVTTAWGRGEAHVVAFDLAAGAAKWRFAAGADLVTWRVRSDGHVLIVSRRRATGPGETWALTLLDAATGAVTNTAEVHTDGATIAVPSDNGELYVTVMQPPTDTAGPSVSTVRLVHPDGQLGSPLTLPGFDRSGEPARDDPAAVITKGSIYYLDSNSMLKVQRLDTGGVVASLPVGISDPSHRYGHRLSLGPTALWISGMGATGAAFVVVQVDPQTLTVRATREYAPYFGGTRVQHPVWMPFTFGQGGPAFHQCRVATQDARTCKPSLFLETPSSP